MSTFAKYEFDIFSSITKEGKNVEQKGKMSTFVKFLFDIFSSITKKGKNVEQSTFFQKTQISAFGLK